MLWNVWQQPEKSNVLKDFLKASTVGHCGEVTNRDGRCTHCSELL